MKLIKMWGCSYRTFQGQEMTPQYAKNWGEAIEWCDEQTKIQNQTYQGRYKNTYFTNEHYVLYCEDLNLAIPVSTRPVIGGDS